jgi:hypothetical protein
LLIKNKASKEFCTFHTVEKEKAALNRLHKSGYGGKIGALVLGLGTCLFLVKYFLNKALVHTFIVKESKC